MTDSNVLFGRVGEVLEGVGGEGPLRLGRTRELIVNQDGGQFQEAAINGKIYIASGVVAGIAPGTVFSTTPPMALWNPPNSGILTVLLQVYLAYVSGTLGAGFMAHGFTPGQNTIPTGGTELTTRAGLLSDSRGETRAFAGSTLVAAPTIIRPSISMGPALATTAAFPFIVPDNVEGAIVIPPGAVWAYQGATLGAGTTPLVCIGAIYKEVQIPT